jgi:hypothetical protein
MKSGRLGRAGRFDLRWFKTQSEESESSSDSLLPPKPEE